jgi:hypothetical protein
MRNGRIVASVSVVGLVLGAPGTALAYLEPGSGNVLVQLIVSLVVAVGVAVRVYWGRLCRLFRRGPTDRSR